MRKTPIIFKQIFACCKRDLILLEYSKIALFHKLMMGPLASLLLVGILVGKLFQDNSSLTIGNLVRTTFWIHLLLGFLVHGVLNSGYYGLSAKLLVERHAGTLAMMFLSPLHPLLFAFGTATLDMMRMVLVSVSTLCLIFWLHPVSPITLAGICLLLVPLFILSICLGWIRTYAVLLFPSRAEIMDSGYMILIFLGALYVPIDAFPNQIQVLVRLNPVFIAKEMLFHLWTRETLNADLLLPLFLSHTLLFVCTGLMVNRWSWKLRAESFG